MSIPRFIRSYLLVFLLFCLSLSIVLLGINPKSNALSPGAEPSSAVLTENVRKTVLDNGLTVLTKEVHTAPVVSVHLWYRVGSRNELPGENGISHLLEHLLFKGTDDRPIQFGQLFDALGSEMNAFTSYDVTAYHHTIEKDKLDAILVLEADRMMNARLDEADLNTEKNVVISELQGAENSPSYRLHRAVMGAAFPEHPYGLMVGGTKADVESFSIDQVQRYYQHYYTPGNATLAVAGDFDTDVLLQSVQEIFGGIKNRTGDLPELTLNLTARAEPKSPVILQEPGSTALVDVVYPLVSMNHPDVPAINLMDEILSGGRSSRLYQALVESGLASDASTYTWTFSIDPGFLDVPVTIAQNQSVESVDQALLKVFDDLRREGVSPEELERAKIQFKTKLARRNQNLWSQAAQIAEHQVISGDHQFGDRYLAVIEQVTPADIQRVAQMYLDSSQRTVGYFEPVVTPQSAAPPQSEVSLNETFELRPSEEVADISQYLPPFDETVDASSQAVAEKITLANGLEILLLPDPSTPIVNLKGWIDAGENFDSRDNAGLASLTSATLLSGTQTKDALTLAKTLEDHGAALWFSTSKEGTDIGGYVLNENMPIFIQTLADSLQYATFPEDQLELKRQQMLTNLMEDMDNPRSVSWRVFFQTVYPEGHPLNATPTGESVAAITQADVEKFYATHYRPDKTVLSLVGGFDLEEMKTLLSETLGNWNMEGQPLTIEYPTIALVSSQTHVSHVIPGKAEAITVMGYDSDINRKDPRYYAAQILNQILGGGTLHSRLGTEIRDRQGLTYGIYSFFRSGIHSGPFIISMQTAPENVEQAINSTIMLLEQLRTQGVTETEIETAKRSLSNSYSVDLADPGRLASQILSNEISGLDLDELRNYPARIEAVTDDQIQQVINNLIHPDRLVIVTTGPAKGT